jgi:hypothetical protein
MSKPSLGVCGHSWKALRLGRRFIRLFPDELDRPKVPDGRLDWKIKYSTVTGLKALAKIGTAVQEVFFVTANPEAVREGLLETPGNSWKPRQGQALTYDSAEQLHATGNLGRALLATPRGATTGKE